MNPGEVILGIKEIPDEKLLDHKVYAFFSHTIKGQKENMPMLKKIIQGGSTLIDYERVTDSQGHRLIFFGNYAGHAGTLDILHLMGKYWEYHGITTPFSLARRAMDYGSVKRAQHHMVEIGRDIERHGLNDKLSPLVIGILGYGNVAKGVQEMLHCLPVRIIPRRSFPAFLKRVGRILIRSMYPFSGKSIWSGTEKTGPLTCRTTTGIRKTTGRIWKDISLIYPFSSMPFTGTHVFHVS
jgi:hypothetical protein